MDSLMGCDLGNICAKTENIDYRLAFSLSVIQRKNIYFLVFLENVKKQFFVNQKCYVHT
jgi:hypothetical protein